MSCLHDSFGIVATAAPMQQHNRVLKHGDCFAVCDEWGDFVSEGMGEGGLYCNGTRHLSRLRLTLFGTRPLLLSSAVRDDNHQLSTDLTNTDVSRQGQVIVPHGTVHLERCTSLRDCLAGVRLSVHNFGQGPVALLLELTFAADFVDVFEVRGMRRALRGRNLPGHCEGDVVTLRYEGLDGVERATLLRFTPSPVTCTAERATFVLKLGPSERAVLELSVLCQTARGSHQPATPVGPREAKDVGHREESCLLHTSDPQFNAWLSRAEADVRLMTTETALGPYPYAGIPWFSTPFGRDGIITAWECLWMQPRLARGVLAFLGATQATDSVAEQDADPGKIIHEMRLGEMAALGEIPFGRYYGSVDATPLFVGLAGAYLERTADREFLAELWPNIEAALGWIAQFGDLDGDGFVEYDRRSATGLIQQGWKDSHDSVFHADGTLAEAPIALCEVQGYTYRAWLAAAMIAEVLGNVGRPEEYRQKAESLRCRFEQDFWCEELDTYALALDGRKRPCQVRTSNAAQCLATGIVNSERAERLAVGLFDAGLFSGWGVRTLAGQSQRYNPMSYHNGSVWPHDNALIAAGLSAYAMTGRALQITMAMFEASQFFEAYRMPELFCGFERRTGIGPTLYPVACAPQAWSAGAVFALLAACLGLRVSALERCISFDNPHLPACLDRVHLKGLVVGEAVVDLLLLRHGNDVGINVLKRTAAVQIRIVK